MMAEQLGDTFNDFLYLMRDDDSALRLYAVQEYEEGEEDEGDLVVLDFSGYTEAQVKAWFDGLSADME